jgi:putative hydrolase of the HAD superfamily
VGRFTGRVLSYEAGSRKPDEGIYLAAIACTNRHPSECLFFDDIQANVETALKLGIRAHLFTGVDGMKKALEANGVRF